ncbi:MAG: GGDEF domain-containing protein [Lachnospiraceae bacterium]|nr:GGDEF domain-containing protein [Lachnospiraceae bacterium]
MNKKRKIKNPLIRSMIISCFVFAVIFSIVIGLVSYTVISNRIMDQYRSHITGVINLTLSRIDAADLSRCIETGEESPAFIELAHFLDDARISFGLDSLIIVLPVKSGDSYEMIYVVSGLLPGERAGYSRKDIPLSHLGDNITGVLPPGFAEEKYALFISGKDISYMETDTAYGETYDAVATIRDGLGEPVGLLISSLSLNEINDTMRRYTLIVAACDIIISLIMAFAMTLWLRRRVINPLKTIEEAVGDFAQKSRHRDDPDALVMENRSVHSGDELESLANSLVDVSKNMRNYVSDLTSSTVKLENMKEEVTRANYMAMRDTLTGVKNKEAFDREIERLDLDIKAGTAEFAVVSVNINGLRRINESFGADNGNISIKKICTMICDLFSHSPVFRIGGDEFIIVLIHRDYKNRDALVSDLKARMNEAAADTSLDEWLRITAAVGVAVYDRAVDKVSKDVQKRATIAMQADKQKTKS